MKHLYQILQNILFKSFFFVLCLQAAQYVKAANPQTMITASKVRLSPLNNKIDFTMNLAPEHQNIARCVVLKHPSLSVNGLNPNVTFPSTNVYQDYVVSILTRGELRICGKENNPLVNGDKFTVTFRNSNNAALSLTVFGSDDFSLNCSIMSNADTIFVDNLVFDLDKKQTCEWTISQASINFGSTKWMNGEHVLPNTKVSAFVRTRCDVPWNTPANSQNQPKITVLDRNGIVKVPSTLLLQNGGRLPSFISTMAHQDKKNDEIPYEVEVNYTPFALLGLNYEAAFEVTASNPEIRTNSSGVFKDKIILRIEYT